MAFLRPSPASFSLLDAAHILIRRRPSQNSRNSPLPSTPTIKTKKKLPGKNDSEEKRELIFKEDGQEYAQVLKMLGNNRLDAQCIDGVKRLAHIRGKMRKKVWVNAGDVVLVGLRDYQDGKADVILKYSAEEARALKSYGELPESLRINEATEALGGKRVFFPGFGRFYVFFPTSRKTLSF